MVAVSLKNEEPAILAHRRARGAAGLIPGTAIGPGGDGDACGETLHVPLEGPRKGLVEVVEVEHQVPRGGVVPAEITYVGVAAELDLEIRPDTCREITCHFVAPSA